ncbi:MAG: DUF4011 domain-containing protein, partial [Planctomycetota bacterium]|nr:DUF4011 domain-containing protein [Planctomycetota bacterium]
MSQTVQSRLKKFQEKLLDLSKRNRLLNYRPLKASTVPIVDELPAEIFRLLVSSSRGFKFLPRPDDGGDERPGRPGEAAEGAVNEAAPGSPPEAPAGGPDPGGATEGAPDGPPLPLEAAAEDLGAEKLAPTRAGAAGPAGPAGSVTSGGSDAGAGPGQLADPDEAARDGEPSFTREFQPYREADLAERHVDRRLQTPLDPQRLDANLLRIYQQASSRLEEQGFNTLFLALGALEWYEPGEPGRPLLAPIILVPVELRRRSPRSPFLLHATDEEPLFNPSLAMKLEREVDVRLSELPDDAEEWDVQRIFEELSDALKEQKSWRVVNDTALGLFSFTKFIMYKDLEASADLFAGHPIICRLCGEPAASEPETSFPAPGEIDALLDPETTYQVLDADSSQQEAILAVKNGASLVLEGPPGTGKSQTITNIVAECLAAGKRVLFVSEKMAALEVVYNRLRHVGLADFCLELHSRHTSKRSVVEELGRTLALGDQRPGTPESDRALTRLQGIRERLNRHVESLAAPLAPLGVTPYEALSRVAALEETPEVALGLEDVASWDRDRFDAALALLEQLANARLDVARDFPDSGNHEHHPWRGSRLPELDYRGSVEIRSALDDEVAALERLRQDAASLAGASASEPPGSTDDVGRLLNLTERLLETPRPSPESLRDPGWAGDAAEALRVVETCRRFAELRGELGSWSPALLDADPERLSRELRGRRGFLRFFQPGWWRVRGELKELRSRPASLPTREAILDDLERGSEARRLREELRAARERGPRLFGALWQGEESDPAALERFGEWIVAFRPHVDRAGDRTRELCELAARGFEATSVPREALARLEESLQRHEATWTRLSGAARLDDEAAFGRRLDLVGFDALATRFAAMAASVEALHAWGRLVTAREACDAAGVGRFIETADEGPVAPDHLARAFERLFLRTWLDHAFRERPELRQFNRRAHEQAIREFQELDLHQLLLARQRLRQRLVEGLPDARWEASARSELGILKREIRRKRGHKPLRKLFRTIPHALAQLKPCFLMSPLSVAQFLDPRLTRFDVVIFDEASQIAPEDAIGAIARGEQLVVVGDSRQLPPTTFFQAQEFLAAGDEGDEETPDLESILDECVVAALPRRMLRWHYRSRHESLIAFSNQHFYDGRLQTFPGCSVAGEDLGVEFVSVDGVFDRSRSRSNPVESEVVAEAVFDHYRRRPELSLGVGTFSQAQQMAILDRLEELRRRDESLEEHFDPDRPEHFFVKNLENIQGDERDVIFISVGYGPDSSGKIRLNFGPLNRAGGERRLNVLVTRARRRLVVFSSMHGADIPESRVSSSGALLLKRYLDYAEHGARTLAPASQEDDAPQETAMERAIARRLEAA